MSRLFIVVAGHRVCVVMTGHGFVLLCLILITGFPARGAGSVLGVPPFSGLAG